MVLKAQCEITIPYAMKALMPKNPYAMKYETYRIDYTFNIASRDGRYRVEIVFGDGKKYIESSQYSAGGWYDATFKTIMNPSQDYINTEVDKAKEVTKKGGFLYSKKKKEAYIAGIPNILQTFSDELTNYANTIFLSINSKVLTADKKDDDW